MLSSHDLRYAQFFKCFEVLFDLLSADLLSKEIDQLSSLVDVDRTAVFTEPCNTPDARNNTGTNYGTNYVWPSMSAKNVLCGDELCYVRSKREQKLCKLGCHGCITVVFLAVDFGEFLKNCNVKASGTVVVVFVVFKVKRKKNNVDG